MPEIDVPKGRLPSLDEVEVAIRQLAAVPA
jgi:hypothetical protein